MARDTTCRVDLYLTPRNYSIVESIRDENALPSMNAAINFIVADYRSIRELTGQKPGKVAHPSK